MRRIQASDGTEGNYVSEMGLEGRNFGDRATSSNAPSPTKKNVSVLSDSGTERMFSLAPFGTAGLGADAYIVYRCPRLSETM